MFEWLLDYQELSNEIDYLEFKLEREKRELKRWIYGDLQGVKLNDKSVSSDLENVIYDIEWELAHKMNDQHDTKKLIGMFRGLDNQILYLKYLEGMTLESIAEELNYSSSYIYKRHAEIMKSIKFAHKLNLHFSYTQ